MYAHTNIYIFICNVFLGVSGICTLTGSSSWPFFPQCGLSLLWFLLRAPSRQVGLDLGSEGHSLMLLLQKSSDFFIVFSQTSLTFKPLLYS